MSLRALALAALLVAACAPRFDPHLVNAPIAGGPGGRTWVSTEQVNHPLVGKIWDVQAGRFVDEAALDAAVSGAHFVALGEVHDNPDHHLLQARLVRAITATGKRPALGFEMLDADQQPAVDASIARAPKDAEALGMAVKWKDSRWPDWAWYKPIFEAGLEAGLPIVAANLPRGLTKDIRTKGKDALEEPLRDRLAREEPIPEKTLAALRQEMAASHCGVLPESLLDPLVLVQRARDAQMAWRMETAAGRAGAVLVTGRGHARTDRAVPAIVAKDAPGDTVIAVAFIEAEGDKPDPEQYREDESATGPAPYDFLVFTPGAKREDVCAGMREHMKKKQPVPAPAPAAPAQ